MSTTGIICEYNPFHKGHQKLIAMERSKNPKSHIVAIMSGNITQRGEFPIFDQWTRAQLAVKQGVDLVIQLPTAFALNSAEHFAKGGVELMNRLGNIDYICCGSENIDHPSLLSLAELLLHPQLKINLQRELNLGLSYPQAITKALNNLSTTSKLNVDNINKILQLPNAILALAYQQALLTTSSKIKLHLHPRLGVNHNDNQAANGFASGTAIRKMITDTKDYPLLKTVVPPTTYEFITSNLNKTYPQDMWIFNILAYKITMMNQDDLSKIQNIREGLEYKLFPALKKSHNLQELILNLKSKRYTYTNLQRTLMYILLNVQQKNMTAFLEAGPLYGRVLAFNTTGQQLLKEMKNTSTIPIITKLSKYLNPRTPFQKNNLSTMEKMLLLDCQTTDLYYQALGLPHYQQADFYTSPIICK